MHVGRIDLLDPTGKVWAAGDQRSQCVYTSRIRVTLTWQSTDAPNRREVSWRGFNAAVLRMPVVHHHGKTITHAGDLTPTQTQVSFEAISTGYVITVK